MLRRRHPPLLAILTIFLLFHPRPNPDPTITQNKPKRHSLSTSSLALSPNRRRAISSAPYPRSAILLLVTTLLLAVLILGPTVAASFSPWVLLSIPVLSFQAWPFFTAILAIVTAFLLPLPQLFTTLALESNAGLSVVMLAAQAPVSIALGGRDDQVGS
ncbi:MAG: hypothetical protein Q9210_006992, partial [Variospora velana]